MNVSKNENPEDQKQKALNHIKDLYKVDATIWCDGSSVSGVRQGGVGVAMVQVDPTGTYSGCREYPAGCFLRLDADHRLAEFLSEPTQGTLRGSGDRHPGAKRTPPGTPDAPMDPPP